MIRLPIIVTNAAMKKIQDIVYSSEAKGMLFYASGGGCSGFNYKLEPTHHIAKATQVGQVYVDPASEMYLLGTTIDYVKEDYEKGIYESKFQFIPNRDVATTCGCGKSFNPK